MSKTDLWLEKYPGKSAEEKLDLNLQDCSWIGLYYPLTKLLAKSVNRPTLRVLEVGVAYGYHADSLLTSLPYGSTYTGIDPYRADYDGEDFFCDDVSKLFGIRNRQDSMNLLFESVRQILKDSFGEHAILFRGDIGEFALQNKNKFDFIWIDGDHRYQAVKRDIEVSWPMLEAGGIMAGDDFNWPDVESAIREFSQFRGVALYLMTNVSASNYRLWWLRKDPDNPST